MRSIGVAMRLYAADHEDNLPARLKTGEKWPHVLMPYLQTPIVFADKSDTNNFIVRQTDPLRHDFNNTSYIMNGFNDVSGNTPDALEVRVNRIDSPAQVILLGTPKSGSGQFYMDMLEGPHGNHIDILDLQRYGNGSNYLFVDGSAKFLSKQEYNHRMWLVNKDFTVPQ